MYGVTVSIMVLSNERNISCHLAGLTIIILVATRPGWTFEEVTKGMENDINQLVTQNHLTVDEETSAQHKKQELVKALLKGKG